VAGLGAPLLRKWVHRCGRAGTFTFLSRGTILMRWTKPEFEVVEVTMEVTAYVARR
jgi:coenzyme PQQ precursor peptide PqqA